MAGIKEDLANKNFKNMYLIYGEEAYLRNYYRTSLRYALTEPDDNLNYSYFEGAGINLEEVVDILDTLPFMSEKRVVICENTGWLSKSDEGGGANLKMLITALDNLSEDVVFILCEEKVDKRSALYKKISTKGLAEEFARQTEESLIRYVINLAGAEQKKIAPNAAAYLVTETGNDMILLGLEVAKLVAYCLDRAEITIKDIDTVCTHQITGKIFDMIAAISARRQKEALRLYYDLLNLRESPYAILALVVRQYNNMLLVRDGMDRNMSVMAIADKSGLKDWLVRRLQGLVAKMNLSEIKDCLEQCVKADEDIKSGNLKDTISIELLIISLSGGNKVQ